jgi:hypothetical protein
VECAETWREAAQHVVSPQNPFHLPEIVMETDWEEVTMLQDEDQEEEDQDQEVTTVGSRRRDSRPPAAADPLFLFAATTPHASWFDVRVVYVRVSACCCSEDVAPEALSLHFPPRNIGTALELNGGRISPSEEAVLVLRRDRVDPESAEATYLSTDYVRTSGPLSFQVFFKDEALVGGTLEQQQQQSSAEANSPVEQQGDDNGGCNSTTLVKSIGGGRRPWSLDCTCVVGQAGCVFSKSRLDDYSSFASSLSLLPAMEVCLVGRHLGTPVILSQTVHLTAARRRSNRQTNTLDVIPEAEELGKLGSLMMIDELALRTNSSSFRDLTDKVAAGRGYGLEGGGYGDGDDGQMTWFNAGVRVGVGLGLGMCLGVGIGVGLIARTFHATSKTLRKGFI